MSEAELRCQLLALAEEHPDAHPYTLALLLQHRSGRIISGRWARELLDQARQERTERGAVA